ncbi:MULTISPECIES: DUF3472 domain-containing protein [Dyella]|uniref:DUF5077 domain-containing protein n=2 Tax=Dyella TaxID=231454 RepID=A0A4R0YZ31_9GAMM|nr:MULTISPECIES: DUF5077 domain-containing protein [Dyella]TBR39836.1 DUF5077 domain-containing protein [Dyella terrae]TCI12584.1 DUF5077 domain-containing protein [Dyella soli]
MRHHALRVLALATLLASGCATAQSVTTVPLGGNAFITQTSKAQDEVISDTGLHNWDSSKAVVSVYFDVQQAGTLDVSLVGALNGASHSKVQVSVGRQSYLVDLSSTGAPVTPVGSFTIDKPGYVKVDLQGIQTDGGYFGDITDLQIGGSATQAGTTFANDPDNFYWSRRGPSVHLGFNVPANTEYFYSEVTVPKGQDPIGSYYMANGFSTGYFGMQVNSATERWVLFSVWDAPDASTTLVRQGPDVIVNGFGGEGTGGQSHLIFPWKAGETYRFLTRAQPDGQGNTLFSAWFGTERGKSGKGKDWHFIATWKYPNTATYMRGVYSFLESFDPDRGYIGREGRFANQWAVSNTGQWTEVTSAWYDVDPTGLNRQRLDFAGGSKDGQFYLRNDGFFSQSVSSGQTFTRPASGKQPDVDLGNLP